MLNKKQMHSLPVGTFNNTYINSIYSDHGVINRSTRKRMIKQESKIERAKALAKHYHNVRGLKVDDPKPLSQSLVDRLRHFFKDIPSVMVSKQKPE